VSVPRAMKKSKGDQAFTVVAAKLWNNLYYRQAPSTYRGF